MALPPRRRCVHVRRPQRPPGPNADVWRGVVRSGGCHQLVHRRLGTPARPWSRRDAHPEHRAGTDRARRRVRACGPRASAATLNTSAIDQTPEELLAARAEMIDARASARTPGTKAGATKRLRNIEAALSGCGLGFEARGKAPYTVGCSATRSHQTRSTDFLNRPGVVGDFWPWKQGRSYANRSWSWKVDE